MEPEYSRMTALSGLGNGDKTQRPRPDLSILTDPTLVEDYDEIMKQMPAVKRDEEMQSVNASVVITPTEALNTDTNSDTLETATKMVMSATIDEHEQSLEADSDEEADTSTGSRQIRDEQDSEYAYSDSDFEDNLEERLRNFETSHDRKRSEDTISSEGAANLGNGSRLEDAAKVNAVAGAEEEEDEEDEEDDLALDWNDNDSDDSDEFQPLNPPQELDPSKLYALYPFQGPDPSHCQLEQDESCILLNDQDSYWWLVKRFSDGKIGFAPAELLETFPERLARLNCWKNENMSSQSISQKNSTEESSTESTNRKDSVSSNLESALNSYSKSNKSVSFNNVVSYAERFINELQGSQSDDNQDEDVSYVLETDQEQDDEHEKDVKDDEAEDSSNDKNKNVRISLIDEIHETHLNDQFADDASEVVSDAAFNVHEMAPLMIKKNRASKAVTVKPPAMRSSDLMQVFQAPIMPVAVTSGGSQIQSSNSNYSLSTIGEYSPSSSEWTNDSPQLSTEPEFESSNTKEQIPQSRAIQDISKIVASHEDTKTNLHEGDGLAEALEVDSKQTSHKPHDSISTLTSTDVKSPTSEQDTRSSDDNYNEVVAGDGGSSHISNEDTGMNTYSAVPSSTSSTCMDHEHISPTVSDVTLPANSTALPDYHPMVHSLYNPIFNKIDVMMERIEKAITQ